MLVVPVHENKWEKARFRITAVYALNERDESRISCDRHKNDDFASVLNAAESTICHFLLFFN
jgi:hypothetical protein